MVEHPMPDEDSTADAGRVDRVGSHDPVPARGAGASAIVAGRVASQAGAPAVRLVMDSRSAWRFWWVALVLVAVGAFAWFVL